MMVPKALFWNIRSVRTQNAFGRVIDLHRRYHYAYIALFEPFIGTQQLQEYTRRIRMGNVRVNCSGKI